MMEYLKLLSPNPERRRSFRCKCSQVECIHFSKCVNGNGNSYNPEISFEPEFSNIPDRKVNHVLEDCCGLQQWGNSGTIYCYNYSNPQKPIKAKKSFIINLFKKLIQHKSAE
jgi:hypothetical protein